METEFSLVKKGPSIIRILILIAIEVLLGWVGFKKSYVICRVGQAKSYVCLQGGWVGQKKVKNMLT